MIDMIKARFTNPAGQLNRRKAVFCLQCGKAIRNSRVDAHKNTHLRNQEICRLARIRDNEAVYEATATLGEEL